MNASTPIPGVRDRLIARRRAEGVFLPWAPETRDTSHIEIPPKAVKALSPPALGHRLKTWRVANSWTRSHVALHLGCSEYSVAEWEAGRRTPIGTWHGRITRLIDGGDA